MGVDIKAKLRRQMVVVYLSVRKARGPYKPRARTARDLSLQPELPGVLIENPAPENPGPQDVQAPIPDPAIPDSAADVAPGGGQVWENLIRDHPEQAQSITWAELAELERMAVGPAPGESRDRGMA